MGKPAYVTLRVRTWHLLFEAELPLASLPLPEDFSIESWTPDPTEYLNIYKTIGDPWGWSGHLRMSVEALQSLLNDDKTLLLAIRHEGDICGFSFIDIHHAENAEILYIGLAPGYEGKGLGKILLSASLASARGKAKSRVWLHTCALDHPSALGFYKASGFSLCGDEFVEELYPLEFAERYGLGADESVDEGFMSGK